MGQHANYLPPPAEFRPGAAGDVYLRDSGGERQDRSVDSQLTEVIAYMKKYRITLRRIYRDEARSGKTIAKRDDFQRMLADYENGDTPAILIIWDYARFARNAREAVVNIAAIEDAGVIVHSLTDNIPDGEYKDLVRYIKHMGNQAEREKNSRAVKRELHQLLIENKAMFGNPPRGLMREALPPVRNERTNEMRTHHKWVPDPALAPLVLRAYEMRAQGASLAEILQATGIYKSVGGFTTFFTNKIYKGVLEFGGKTIENYCEPIVSPELWDRVNAIRHTHKPGNGIHDPARARSRYILSGLMVCQECGGAMSGHQINGWSYYICATRKGSRGTQCRARYIPKEKAETAALEAIKDSALSLEVLVNVQARVNRQLDRNQEDTQRARTLLDRELSQAQQAVSNLTSAIAKRGDSAALLAALDDAETTLKEKQIKIRQLENSAHLPKRTSAQLKGIANEIARILTDGTDEEKQSTIRRFTTRILARRDEASLQLLIYYIPIKIIDPDQSGSLGNQEVPPRGSMSESLIEITLPMRASRSGCKRDYTKREPTRGA